MIQLAAPPPANEVAARDGGFVVEFDAAALDAQWEALGK
jgi:hypothetical protein